MTHRDYDGRDSDGFIRQNEAVEAQTQHFGTSEDDPLRPTTSQAVGRHADRGRTWLQS